MKQIIPFKKELLFKTKVSEITSISLEHTLSLKNDDLISGEFQISGDYKMTEGSINREKFFFQLPFDIALDARYDMDTIVIDIDNFYYEIINNEALQVNIDVYVEGEKLEIEEVTDVIESETTFSEEVVDVQEEIQKEVVKEMEREVPIIDREDVVTEQTELTDDSTLVLESIPEEDMINPEEKPEIKRVEELPEEVIHSKGVIMDSLVEEQNNVVQEFNIFENMDHAETYVTYHVYIVKEGDTIDGICEKYGVSKEEIAVYNNLEEVQKGCKLIIPYHHE